MIKMLMNNKRFAIFLAVLLAILIVAFSSTESQARAIVNHLKVQQQTVHNGVTISLMEWKLGSPNPSAVACIDLPSTEDWLPYARIEVGGKEVQADGVALINSKDPTTYASKHRCYEFSFPSFDSTNGVEGKLVVVKLQTTLPEVLSRELCASANQKVESAGVKFECSNGDHGGKISITSKPSDLNELQALELISQALVKTVEGPWEFAIKP